MKYNFDKLTDRRNTFSVKWNVAEDELPMWVADMDFECAPEIRDALIKRAEHGIFGYTDLPDEWYNAYIGWQKRRHGWEIERDSLVFVTGIVPAISSTVRKLTTPNEKVVIQTPVYNVFFNSILNNGCRVEQSPLIYENGEYKMDLCDLESKLADPQTTLMILCNPQNPVGKIWDRDTLAEIGELCKKHSVTVISDEIHCDITDPELEYTPFASVNDTCRDISITCVAPTKTFNLAGLQTAAVIIPNPVLRHKVWRGINTDEVGEPNAFAVTGAIAALELGEAWLDEMRAYVKEGKDIARGFIEKEIPEIHLVDGHATYLLWVDLGELYDPALKPAQFIREHTGLFVSDGGVYGEGGRTFLRINIACPHERLRDGLNRLKRGIELYKEHLPNK